MADLTFTGQTDETITVQLPSRIIYAKWRGSATSAGGTITIEVLTQWVANSSDITITMKDRDDGEIEVIQGKVWNNLFRKEYTPEPNDTQGLKFTAEMSAHSLEADSNIMRVFPTVTIENLQFLNGEDEAVLETIADGQDVILDAEVTGPPDGTKCLITLHEQYSEHESTMIFSQEVLTEAGHVKTPWTETLGKSIDEIDTHETLARDGEEYYQPGYWFTVEAYATKEKSDTFLVSHNMILNYIVEEGNAGEFEGKTITVIAPDSTETAYSIPADGKIVVERSLPGTYLLDESEIKELL
ncbi:MAG: hypothetical protein OCD01_16985 [Fibrobacterales bacterium]